MYHENFYPFCTIGACYITRCLYGTPYGYQWKKKILWDSYNINTATLCMRKCQLRYKTLGRFQW